MSRCVSSFHEIAIIVFNASPQLRDVNFISTQQKKKNLIKILRTTQRQEEK